MQSQLVALENTIGGLLRQEGIGLTDRRTAFEAAVREAMGEDCLLQAALHPLLETRNVVLRQRAALGRQILRIVRGDPVCRRLITAPGVGALVSLAFRVAVRDPRRFSRSGDVGGHFVSTPREHSSGELSYQGRISKTEIARSGGCSISQPAACCGAMQRCGARSKPGLYASPSALAFARRALHWHANSRSCCMPCGAADRYSSGDALRHRRKASSTSSRVFRAPARPRAEDGGKALPRGRDGVGRERGYPLGARGSPCDADYEDASVPLQLPLSCVDHCIEARTEGCHPREIE